MIKGWCSVLERDCEAKYYIRQLDAQNYILRHYIESFEVHNKSEIRKLKEMLDTNQEIPDYGYYYEITLE